MKHRAFFIRVHSCPFVAHFHPLNIRIRSPRYSQTAFPSHARSTEKSALRDRTRPHTRARRTPESTAPPRSTRTPAAPAHAISEFPRAPAPRAPDTADETGLPAPRET